MSTQKVTGLVSGFDTQSIVDSLMRIEKVPYEKLDIKKQTEQLKLQAYQAVNTYLLKFRTSVSTLSSSKLWNSKATVSTNDKSITASANEYAVNGSYSFKVAQLATAAQYMSKGFASSKTALKPQPEGEEPEKLGSIKLSSSKARVDNSAKLEQLNGGKGVFRGSVRITDSTNATSVIDLSSCDTMDDVVRTLNESANAQISAAIKDGKLVITDEAGGTRDLKIQNVGAGTTATDLGISGTFSRDMSGELYSDSRNVFVMGDDMQLSMLNDGLGVEEGQFAMRVSGPSSFIDVVVDVNGCQTVGDVIKRVNDEIDRMLEENAYYSRGQAYPSELLDGLRFGLSEEKTSFALSGTTAGNTYSFFDNEDPDNVAQQRPGADLGLSGKTETATSNDQELSFGRVLGDVNSPMLKHLGGAYGGGVSTPSYVPTAFTPETHLTELWGGEGLDISRPMMIQLWEGVYDNAAGAQPRVFNDIFDPIELKEFMAGSLSSFTYNQAGVSGYTEPNMDDLKNYMNEKLAAYAANPDNDAAGLTGMSFEVDYYNNRMYVANAQSGYTVEIAGSMAHQLGLSRQIGSETYPPVELDADDPANQALLDSLKTFYDYDGSGGISLVGTNNAMDSNTTLGDLVDWPGVGDIATSLGQTVTFTFATGPNPSDQHTLSFDFTGLLDKDGNPVDANTNVQDFMDAINKRIQDEFDSYTSSHVPPLPDMAAPKLGMHRLQDRFQWTNMDFTKGWSMGGGIFTEFNLDRTMANLPSQDPSAIYWDVNPAATAIVDPYTADGSTLTKDWNYGLGLTLAGEPTDSIIIDLGDGKVAEVTMQELRDRLFLSISDGGLGYTRDTLTGQQYVDALNDLVKTQLDATGTGAAITFAIKDGNMIATGITNADRLVIGGDAAFALQTGIDGGTPSNFESDPAKEYVVGNLNAATVDKKPLDGIGDIDIQIGNSGTVVTLKTTGLTEESTLNDLIDQLNSELDRLSLIAGNEELAKVRFGINDSGTGIGVENGSKSRMTFKASDGVSTLAQDLGLVGTDGSDGRVESYSFKNCGSLGRNYISRATQLSEYMGKNAEMGTIQISNALGDHKNIDLSNAETIGDVIDAINYWYDDGFGIYAQINDAGDGITLIEAYPRGMIPREEDVVSNIGIKDLDGGTLAKKLGIAGTGNRDKAEYRGNSVLEGSLSTTIDVMSTDTLESIMFRLAESGQYKTAIVNDGSATNPYRLSISAVNTGEASDFVIESDLDILGFTQTSRGRDSKVLYGDPNSNASPVMLSSSTNSNSNAILGLTLDLKQATAEWTTITVDTDKEGVKDEIKNMVEAYNELAGIVTMLDAYDEETGEPGILFNDNATRSMMNSINDFFYEIYNPNNKRIGSLDENGKQNTWSWMDLGISLTAKNSNPDGSGSWYSTMDLDLDKLDDMVASNWDILSNMLANQRNASNRNLDENVRPTASFSGALADGFDVDNAINGDYNKANWGAGNGIMAEGTIADGNNEYTIFFQQPTTVSRMSIYHYSADTALKDFTVEYLDANTGKWEVLRPIEGNSSDANYLGMPVPTTVNAIRIRADSTNASDGKFRLLDVQVFEEVGLAGRLNNLTTSLGDTQTGFLAERNTEITSSIRDIEEQMARLQERLDAKEASMWRRFTAMETALGNLQNQSSYFSSMMSSMNANNNN